MKHLASEKIPSHQLRTALHSIVGFSKLLLSGQAGNLSAEQRKQIDYIYQAGYDLMEEIQDEKPQVIILWSGESHLVNTLKYLFKEKVEKYSRKKVIWVDETNLNALSLQKLKEKYHTILLALPPWMSHKEHFFKDSDAIVIISSSHQTENENQVLFLKTNAHLASRVNFYTLNSDSSQHKLDTLIRKMTHRMIGIALSSGTAHSIVHVGVLKAFHNAHIPIDLIAGTSGGALYGALFATGMDIHEIESLLLHAFKHNLLFFSLDVMFSRKGLFSPQSLIRKILQNPLKSEDILFNTLKTPLLVAVTDLIKGKERVCYAGSVIDAVRASMSIPAIFSPIKKGDDLWVDGVVTMPIPVLPLVDRGVDICIAVQALTLSTYTKKNPHILDIFMRARNITSEALSQNHLKHADIVIQPDTNHIGYLDYHKARELIFLGEEAAVQALPKIQEKLGLSGLNHNL